MTRRWVRAAERVLPKCALVILLVVQVSAQTIVGSARVICREYDNSGPIVGVIINQTTTTIKDLEVELSVLTRNKKGELRTERDTRFVVVPSVNQGGVITQLQSNEHLYFNIPDKERDQTCRRWVGRDQIPNVAAIAITRINGRPMLPADKNGKPMKRAPVDSMLVVPRDTPEHVPTLHEVIENNARLSATIINSQLNDCLLRGTWACTFQNDTNINVVISQK